MASRAARLSRLLVLSSFRGRLSAPIATLTTIAFLATFAPPRTARAGFETAEPADTPNFADSSNGTKAAAESASATTKATKARKTPVSAKGGFTTSVALQLPPGRLGMTPSLSLNYDSTSVAESAVGVGWSFGPPAISRSTRNGFPKVTGMDTARVYDPAFAVFTGPDGEMVGGADGPAGATNLYAPMRETRAVRYEYLPAGDGAFVEHDPSGKKRYYGLDPYLGRTARITNELGTHAWLLVREEDPYGNYIAYSWNADESTRVNRAVAQTLPILQRVEWGGNRITGQVPPFRIDAAAILQSGPINLLEGNTILQHAISKIDVLIDGVIKWTYTLSYTTSETGKLLLAYVDRAGDAPERTTFTYSRGAPSSGPRFVAMGAFSSPVPLYSNTSRWSESLDPFDPVRPTPEQAVQAPGYRPGARFIDINGDGTTDVVYHSAGIGTTQTHVLWEESVLQSPSAAGLGSWTSPQTPAAGENQPQTGLPFFPLGGGWATAGFQSAMMQDLTDLDGDGDADTVALAMNASVEPNVGVALLNPPPPLSDPQAVGQMRVRIATNTARLGAQHSDDQIVSNWPPGVTIVSTVRASSGPFTNSPLYYKVEPKSDVQLPIVDLNADGRADLVLLKHRGVDTAWVDFGDAFALPHLAMMRLYGGMPTSEEGEIDDLGLETEVRELVANNHAQVIVDEDLLLSGAPPGRHVKLWTNAGRLAISELPRNTPVVVLSAAGGIPAPGLPSNHIPIPSPGPPPGDWVPPQVGELPWWHPLVDPWGDVFLPLKDAYWVAPGGKGASLLEGASRFVPRVYLTGDDSPRTLVSEPDVNTSNFERSLQSILNAGSANECGFVDCQYPAHVNFSSYFADVNGDGLPDLVYAEPPVRMTVNGQSSLYCKSGHKVRLNRGYAFEAAPQAAAFHSWGSPDSENPNSVHPLSLVANRDRFCYAARPSIKDTCEVGSSGPQPGAVRPTFPTSAMAQADLDADGRVDLVLAYQRPDGSVNGGVYRNTGRGYATAPAANIALPSDVALARNVTYPGNAPSSLQGWPRGGLGDMARFVDLDNDGLVDIVTGGLCAKSSFNGTSCSPARWYRNAGTIPDRMERIDSSSKAWTTIEYETPKAAIVSVPEGGLHPPATTRVVSKIRSARGPVPIPAGPAMDPFDVQEIRFSYDKFVKDVTSNEVLGFEKITADFVNAFDGVTRETVRVTRTFDVQPLMFDVNGTPLPVRHPLKGAVRKTVTESGGWISTDESDFFVDALATGIWIRPRRESHRDESPSGLSAWTADETTQLDAYRNPTEHYTGNFDGTFIVADNERLATGTEYENRTTGANKEWQIGLVTREQTQGYSEDIGGNPDSAHVLSNTTTSYNAQGSVQSRQRVGIKDAACAGLADDNIDIDYWPHGLLKATHEIAGPNENVSRDVTFTYDAKNLYVASAQTRVGRMSAGIFVRASTTLTVSFQTDLRHGKNTSTTDPNGAVSTSTYDSSGRVLTRKGPDNTVLESNVYVDSFPVSVTSTITTDVGMTYQRKTHLDGDDRAISVVEGTGTTAVPWSRKSKTRFDAFGRAVVAFLPAFVSSIDGGITPSTGAKEVTAYDGFDRVTQVTAADGTVTTTAYEPRQVTETNARGFVTRRTMNAAGALITVERNPGGTDATQHAFVRDGRGEILSVTDGDGHVRRFERDGGGRLRHVTLPTAPGETPTRFSMCHDVQDKLVHLESPAGRTVDILYDELGRSIFSTGTDATGLTVQTSQTYDKKPDGTAAAFGLGRLTSKTDESGVYALTYDNYGRPKTLSLAPSIRAKAGATNVAASYGATYSYTPAGALTSVVFSGVPTATATGLTYTRDVKGRATSIDAKSGTTATPVATGLAASVTYDAADRVTSARYGNQTSGEWTFNPLTQRLDKIAYKTSTNAILAAVTHIYDDNDNLLEERREREGTAGFFSQKVHTYDALDRLRTSDRFTVSGNTSESYVFSPSGNLLGAGDDAYGYASPATSQAATSVTNGATGAQRALAYDADGYLATDQQTEADGATSTRSLQFDPMGCMRSITREDLSAAGTSSSAASEYTCGLDGRVVARDTTKADGSRARRIDFAGVAEIRPDEGVFMLRVPLTGSVTVEDARSLSDGARVTAMSGYLVNDARGSVLATTGFLSSSPGFTGEAEYDAWGKKIAGYSALSAPRHGFVGAEEDAAVGTYSFGARSYDPALRRWVSPDPLLIAAPSVDENVGEALNLYGYADGNPVKNTDKSGYCGWCEAIAAGAVAGAAVQAVAYAYTAPTNLSAGQFAKGALQAASNGAYDGAAAAATALVAEAAAYKAVSGIVRVASGETAAARGVANGERQAGTTAETSCFPADTPVLTESGPQPIQTIQAGDHVWSRQEAGGEVALHRVARVFKTADQPIVDVHASAPDGATTVVRATPAHPFWVAGRAWVAAADLRTGDELWSNGDTRWAVTNVARNGAAASVYNLEVDGAHTYFAGAAALWVHNTCDVKAEQLKVNARQGAAAEKSTQPVLEKNQTQVQPQITVKTDGGKTRLDFAGKNKANGKTELTEVKSGEATLSANQKLRHAELANSGGVVAGKGKPGFPGGTKIPPTKVDVVRVPSPAKKTGGS